MEVGQQLQQELHRTMERLRHLGGAVVLEDIPGAVGDNSPPADPFDEIQLNEEREMSFATRSLLVERANRLAEALDRLRRGAYGFCEECGEPIAPARLRAMPEVTTCVRCQGRLERLEQRIQKVGVRFGDDEEEE
jgi:RNA polymerase-binding transcription factor DksA